MALTQSEIRLLVHEFKRMVMPELKRIVNEAVAKSDDRVMDAKQAAEYLGCKRRTIYNLKDLIPHEKVGNLLRFRKSGLDAFKERHTFSSTQTLTSARP